MNLQTYLITGQICRVARPAPWSARHQAHAEVSGRARGPALQPARSRPARLSGIISCRSVSDSVQEVQATALGGKHVLLCLVDSNQHLSDSSRDALAEAAAIVRDGAGLMTIFVANMAAADTPERDERARALANNVEWHLGDRGVQRYEVHFEDAPDCVSASLSDVADARSADLVVISSSAVHSKQVNANLLAEFCPCPILMLP